MKMRVPLTWDQTFFFVLLPPAIKKEHLIAGECRSACLHDQNPVHRINYFQILLDLFSDLNGSDLKKKLKRDYRGDAIWARSSRNLPPFVRACL